MNLRSNSRSGDTEYDFRFLYSRQANYPFFVYNTPSITITLIDETRARYRDTPRIQRIMAHVPMFFLIFLPLLLLSHFQYRLIIYKQSCVFSRKQRLLVSLSLSLSLFLSFSFSFVNRGTRRGRRDDKTSACRVQKKRILWIARVIPYLLSDGGFYS